MNSDSSLKKHHPGRNRARRRFSMFSVLSLALLLAIFLAALGAVLPARATPWYVRDQFATNAFNNQNGNVNWASDWTEINDTGGATGGNVQVTGGELRVNSRIVTNDPDFEGVQRSVNLSTAATATLSFTFRTTNLEADDTLSVDVYNGSTWTTLETLSGSSTGARRTYDITAYRNANSAIRFQITANFDQTNESIFFDNVEVSYTVGGSHTSASVLQTVQTYYIPVPENQALDVLDSINAAAVSPTSVYLSITVNADGTVIYYDHWEDGFETRINDPIQATTDVWGDNNPANGMPPGYATDYLQAGDVIILNNVVDVTGWPASLVIKYDGGDKIASTEAIAVTRTSWASGSNTLHAGSIEMLDISVWGERFDMPADTDDQANDFDYAGLAVMASVDGTQIYLNGSLVTTINEGQSYLFADNTINGGDRVTTNAGHPVQAAFLTGDIGSNYESSWFTLYPYDLLGTSYYSVVPGFATPARTTRVFIENPNTNTITVHYQFYGGSEQTIDVPSYATVSIVVPTTPGTGGRFWTTDGSRFQAISVIDSGGQAADWGYTLVPENQLTQQAQVGWGAGQDPTLPLTENGSPVWVMAVGSGTMYVCADYNGDGLGALTDNNGHHYDQLLTLNSLQQAKVYDSDGDQTGMLLYLCNGSESANNRGNNIAVAWGQDPTRASTGAPGLDVGTTVPPLPNFTAIKGATLITDINGDGKFDVGETFEYVIRVSNVGAIPIPPNTITVEDIIPAYTTYVPNSTRVDGVLVPDNTSGTPFPLDEGGIIIDKVLPIEGRFLITFQVVINTDIPSTQTIQNNARVSGLDLLYDPHVEIVVDPPTKLGDRIWLDLDGDGVQDAGEPGIPGVTVELYNGSCVIGSTCPTQVTNANGQYTFSGLIDNTYTVIVRTATLPGGLTQTGDPDGCPGAGCDNQHQVTIGPGNTNKPYWNADFGYRGNVSIGDFVWYDIDRDGVQDGGAEVGLSGVTVILTWAGPDNDLATTGDNITLTTTTSGGAYLFSGLPAGTYRVDLDENTLPAGYAPTTTDPLILNNLAAGTNYTAADFGAAPGASIGNLVWNDMDNDGNQDPGESGISGVRVYIDANGNGSYDPGERYAITDANGAYLIDRLAAGSYVVRVDPATVPPNMVLTTANIPLAVILSAGEAYTTADFGYRSTALAMVKTSDAGASVLPGDDVLYTLTVVNNSSIIQTGIAVTDPLPAETSYVPNSTIASGYVASFYSDSFTSGDFSGSGVGSLAWAGDWQETDSTGAGPAAGAIRVVNAPACPNGQCLRFQLVNAGDLIYRQADLSIPACTAPGATVALQYRYNNQLAGANDQLQVRIYTGTTQRRTVATYTSANQGSGTVYFPLVANEIANDTRVQLMRINDNDVNYFYFDDVSFVCLNSATRDNAPGGYPDLGNGTPPILVRLEDGFALPPGGTMTVTYHVTVDADTGGATHITNIGQTTSIQNIYPQQASVSDPIAGWIRGQVRYDIDMDGVLNETPPEPGLAGAQVALYTDPNGDGDPSDGVQVGSTITTDPSGNYVFSDVLPGNYVVVEINPPGYASTADSAGANDDRIPVVLTAGANSTGNDFLDTNMVIISDLVWNDRNADGIQDPDGLDDILGTADDEVGIDGVTVRLLDGSGTQVATTTTSGGGLYSFIVPAGTYRVDFVLPVGYVFSPANQGSDDALDSDADPITGETANYTLAAGVTNATIDAGMYLANPALNVIKEVSAAAGGPWSHSITVNAGDTVYYRVRVQNTGNITLTGLTVDDGMVGCTLTRGADVPGDNDADFEVGETWVYTCSLTAAAGSHTNTATADTNETDPDTDDAEYFGNAPALNVIKEVSADNTNWFDSVTVNAGDTVYYRVRVQNTGNITLTGLTVDDGMAGCTLTRGADVPGDNDTDFEVGETWVYTCSLTAAAGTHTNTATADTNETDPDTDDAEYFGNAPALNVIKEVSAAAGGPWSHSITVNAGDTVYYRVRVQNTGNIMLTGLTVDDGMVGCTLTRGADAPGDNDADFEVGETWVYTCSLTAAAGTHTNTATADTNETDPDTDDAEYFGNAPALNVIKEVSAAAGGPWSHSITVNAGDTVYYRVRVQNTGNITLTGLTVDDGMAGCTLTRGADAPGDNDADFEVGETWVYTCSLTAAAGSHTNTATADTNETDPDTDDAEYFGNAPALNVIKEVSAAAGGPWSHSITVNAGDTVYYRVRVQNTGNITLTGLTVDDGMVGCTLTRGADAPGDNDTDFEVGETWVYTCSLTAAAGSHTNTATADTNETDPDTDDAEYFGNAPLIGVAKRVVGTPVEVAAGTWEVTYQIQVRNYGNADLTALQVTDDLAAAFPPATTFTVQSLSSADFTVNWPGYNGATDTNLLAGTDALPVGASGTITLVVRVVPVSSGPFWNWAYASALPPVGPRVDDLSQDGANPDPDGDGDPTNNDQPTPVSFGPTLFDPPFGIKLLDPNNLPILRWTMVWINNSNIVAVNARVIDEIPAGTTYVAGSLNCYALTPATITTSCDYEAPTPAFPRGRIVWTGIIGPDLGATDQFTALNELYIEFSVRVDAGISEVRNEATVDSDLNGDGDPDDPGEQRVALANNRWTAAVTALPATGFAPGRVTDLSGLTPVEYAATGDLRLEIPALGVDIPIVGVPRAGETWDVTWLGNQAGWLEGTAFPSWNGNSVLTSHVYLANGLPGPFVNLSRLRWGDQIILHAYGNRYIYEVRSSRIVGPDDLSALRHEELPWLTLVTCRQYDEASSAYRYRVVVRAVLMRVTPEP